MRIGLWLVVMGIATVVSLVPSTAVAHERKDVAGLTVLFGAEPEPALTEEVEFLRWRFTAHSVTFAFTIRDRKGLEIPD